MRRAIVVVVLAALTAGAPRAQAQGGSISSTCPARNLIEIATQDACQKAVDVFQLLGPQLGVGIVGGSAVLGDPGALRGPGHVSLGLRVNAVRGYLPRVERINPAITGAVPSDYETKRQMLPVPTVDAAVGLFRGVRFAGTYALAVDGLVNLAYLPSFDGDDIDVAIPDGSVKLGYGARVALLQETFATPAITVSYLRRDLPVVDVTGRLTSDTISLQGLDVSTSAFRAVVGKSFFLVGLLAGYGVDKYESSALVSARIHRGGLTFVSAPVDIRQDLTRRNLFFDASLNLPALKLVAEVGRVSGGTIATFNSFGGRRADDALTYGSLGLRLSR